MLRAVLHMRTCAGRCKRVRSARRVLAARLDGECDDRFCVYRHARGYHVCVPFVSEIAPPGLFFGLGIPDRRTRSGPGTKRHLSSLAATDFAQLAFNIVRTTLTCEAAISTNVPTLTWT